MLETYPVKACAVLANGRIPTVRRVRMTQMIRSSGQKGFGKVGMRGAGRRTSPHTLIVPIPETSQICEEEVEEIVEATPESRPTFIPPSEEELRELARDAVQGYRGNKEIADFLPIFESYARICSPGSQAAAVEDFVLAEFRRYMFVIKGWPDRPDTERIGVELLKYGQNIPDLIKVKVESMIRGAGKSVPLSPGRSAHPIVIGSRRCYIVAQRNGHIEIMSLLTEKEFKQSRRTTRERNPGIFRRPAVHAR